jgi:allophanate hydrolase
MISAMGQPLDIASLRDAYAAGVDPAEILTHLHGRIMHGGVRPVWIALSSLTDILARLGRVKQRRDAGESLPLFGIPFAVKDNIDIAGMATTAACPGFSHVAQRSATVIEKLEAAGAIPLGKTNLDQFATGLTGTRSPYGIPSSVFDPTYISGGSSSGSAVAVAQGVVSFALGTDTAGSGRVPAAFNNIVGLKPTKGWLSTAGLVPACRSLDCVSVFAGTADDAISVARIAAGFDKRDPFARHAPTAPADGGDFPMPFRFGVPAAPLEFFGDDDAADLFAKSVTRLEQLGGVKTEIDFAPFREACQLLYGGPWVAERLAAIKAFAQAHSDAMLPVTREIILGGARLTAVDAFEGGYRLAELAQRADDEWARMDVMLLPTTGTIYRIADVLADPIRLNSNLGLYTNFVNLLDLSAIAVPAGFRRDGLPVGITLMARAFRDDALASLAGKMHRALPGTTVGATGRALPHAVPLPNGESVQPKPFEIAVLGAHLSGQALNHELTQRGARLVRTAWTSAGYSLYALATIGPPRPGLVFDGRGRGGIELEIWTLRSDQLGTFLAEIPSPLGIGTITLADGSTVKGFLCEAHASRNAADITSLGSWRAYLRSLVEEPGTGA